jgi:AraC-like DNA-binding protein
VSDRLADQAQAPPAPPLAPYVRRYTGYRYRGLPAGRHLGLPSLDLTLVLGLDGPTTLLALPDPAQPAGEFVALAGGLHTRPAVIGFEGAMEGMQLSLTPAGARALLGVPAAELAETVTSLDALLGRRADELLERLHACRDWPGRFAVLDRMMMRWLAERPPVPAPVERAWQLLASGRPRVAAVARHVGYSRRQLDVRCAREYGLAPKQLARLGRFERSHRLLKRDPAQGLAAVAAACGYYDQAHMAREWNALAGCPPSRWLRDEQIPFVQDDAPRLRAPLAA